MPKVDHHIRNNLAGVDVDNLQCKQGFNTGNIFTHIVANKLICSIYSRISFWLPKILDIWQHTIRTNGQLRRKYAGRISWEQRIKVNLARKVTLAENWIKVDYNLKVRISLFLVIPYEGLDSNDLLSTPSRFFISTNFSTKALRLLSLCSKRSLVRSLSAHFNKDRFASAMCSARRASSSGVSIAPWAATFDTNNPAGLLSRTTKRVERKFEESFIAIANAKI